MEVGQFTQKVEEQRMADTVHQVEMEDTGLAVRADRISQETAEPVAMAAAEPGPALEAAEAAAEQREVQ